MSNSTLGKAGLATAALLLAAAPGWAQNERTGTSMAEPVVTTAADLPSPPETPAQDTDTPAAPVVRTAAPTVYLPYTQTGGDPDAVADAPRRELVPDGNTAGDPDAGIVTSTPVLPGELADGTLVRVSLREQISTLTTRPGSEFSAEVTEPVVREGRVVIPVGAVLEGRVTMLHGGSRISGGAAIHLEARAVTLPDGTHYVLHARVIDTDSWNNTRVNDEGTILRRDHAKATMAAVGLATGGGAAAGAMIGGVPGALIGAGVGAGVGTVVWLKQDREAELPKDLGLIFSLTLPMEMRPLQASGAGGADLPGGE